MNTPNLNLPATNTPEKNIFSVSQLNRRAKQLLETHLPLIWVSGEISNLAKPSSGHWYFTLKDDRAQVRCAMFKNANQRLRWQPESGNQVLIRARVSLYEGRGEYQLIAEHMEDSGAGALQQAYEALKLKLQQEGLFDEATKQALPLFPTHIGVITSPTGAAIRDILSVLERRYPIAPVTIIPVAVQGANAAAEMVQALSMASNFKPFDLLIIGRGGGSIEDLWAFNDETLARTIAHSPIPIISAVGHEVDFTICDFVADVRAPTPSSSAEIATPDLAEWEQALDVWRLQLIKHQQLQLKQKQKQLVFLQKRLRHPGEQIKHQKQLIQQYQKSFVRSMAVILNDCNKELSSYKNRYLQQQPRKPIQRHQDSLKKLNKRIIKALNSQLSIKRQQIVTKAHLLNAVNPLDILARGYSVVTDTQGDILKNTQDINIGDELMTQLGEGSFVSKVIKIDS
jgi:exodeoxyribonuclease VII large subunit